MVSMSPSWGDWICEFESRHETCLVDAERLGIGGPINKLPVIRARWCDSGSLDLTEKSFREIEKRRGKLRRDELRPRSSLTGMGMSTLYQGGSVNGTLERCE